MEKKVLVVDDEAELRDMLKEAFSVAGYTVVDAPDAEKALEILKQQNIQVMFLDLNLPGMNGIDLCREIRKDHPIACIYGMTGFVSLFELSDCREAGFDDYFTKPINLELLFDTAKSAFEKLDRWRKN